MKAVTIRGMEMPTNCSDCPLNYDQMSCIVTGTRWWSDTMVLMGFDSDKERLHDCPLIAVELEIHPPVDIAATETEVVMPLEMMDKLLRGGAE